jgi:hypothetical protein
MQTCQELVATGGACTNSFECDNIGDNCLSATMTCGPGGKLGATCTTTNDCALLTYCATTTMQCTARPTDGQSCATVNSCQGTDYCDQTTMLCTAPKPDGAMCQNQSECQSRRCDSGGTHQCYTPPVCI